LLLSEPSLGDYLILYTWGYYFIMVCW